MNMLWLTAVVILSVRLAGTYPYWPLQQPVITILQSYRLLLHSSAFVRLRPRPHLFTRLHECHNRLLACGPGAMSPEKRRSGSEHRALTALAGEISQIQAPNGQIQG